MDIKQNFPNLENSLLDSLNIGLWEYDIEKEEINFSSTTQRIIGAETQHLSLKQLLAIVYKEDQQATHRHLTRLVRAEDELDIVVRLNNPAPYHQWVNIKGIELNTAQGKTVLSGQIQDTSSQTLVKQIQSQMYNLLSNVIEHIDAKQTLLELCQLVNDLEPAIHCIVVLNTESEQEQILINAPTLPESLVTILSSITLSDEQSELYYTYEKRRAVMIPDLYRLIAWRSVEQLELDESHQCFIGQSIYCNNNKLQGAVCLYLPDDSLGEDTLNNVIDELNKLTTIIIEQQLQRDTQDKIQQQLNHSQKMDSLGHLTGGIAHDFNNILGSIIGYNSLSRKIAAQLEHEKLSAYVNEVGIAADRAKDLISQMMVFSRSEKTTPLIIDAQIVIKEVLQLIRSIIPSSIDINASYSKHCPKIKVNPISLHQVLLNHMINAKDAIPNESGSIQVNLFPAFRVSQTCSSCHERFKGNYVAIEISDDGHGISSETIPKIFNPFFTTKDVGRGTGMGLSVVHGILHGVNSHITVTSQPNKGTKITLYFPEAEITENDIEINEPLVADRNEQSGSGQHIMVVDDDVPLSLLFAEILESNGYQVSRFEYPKDALLEYQTNPQQYDLVLSDQTMPAMTGDQLAVEMLRINPKLPIILCTGYSKKLTTKMADKIGIACILRKPVAIHDLVDSVNKYLKEQIK